MAFRDTRRFDAFALVEVRRTEQIGPHFLRVTVGGPQLATWPRHGFDQWFRLFLPQGADRTGFDLPDGMDCIAHLDFLRLPSTQRPQLRSYTVRELRTDPLELDIDLVLHGDDGVAGRWARRTRPGDRVALLDQGCGYELAFDPGVHQLLVTDETGLPAVAGILRDLPRDAHGDAFIELADPGDRRELAGPEAVTVHWLTRAPGQRPGTLAIDTVMAWTPPGPDVWAYLVGERAIPTTLRRWLVTERGVNKAAVSFVGYWRIV